MTGRCIVCQTTFKYSPSNRSGKYCSQACSHACPEWREKQAARKRGKVVTAEARARMSASRKGVPKPPGFGDKLRAANLGKQVPWASGERSHWWKGGITKQQKGWRSTSEYRRWRQAVLDRDGKRCTECGASDRLEVDHLTPFILVMTEAELCSVSEWIFDIDNGRTLCQPCHRSTPTYARKSEKLIEMRLLAAIVAATPDGTDAGTFYMEEMDRHIGSIAKAVQA